MDVRSLPALSSGGSTTPQHRLAMSGPSSKKKPNFVIQESITFNNGKITSCYTSNACKEGSLRSAVKDKQSFTQLKNSKNATGEKIVKQHNDSFNVQLHLKALPSTSIDEKPISQKKKQLSNVGKPNKKPVLSSMKSSLNTKLLDTGDRISRKLTPKLQTNEIAISSEVTLQTPLKTNKRDLPQTSEAIKTLKKSPSEDTKLVHVHTIGHKKKLKKKKKRFRNLEGSEDEDDWPAVTLVTSASPVVSVTDSLVHLKNVSIMKTSPVMPGVVTKPKDKVQVLQEYIFPSPNSLKLSAQKRVEKVSNKMDKPDMEQDGHLSDDSVSSIQSKMSAISDFNLNGSFSELDVANIEPTAAVEQDSLVFQDGGDVDAESGEIFCAYDDEGNLMCLQKDVDGQFILLPTEQDPQQDDSGEVDAEALNNNFLDIESKEEKTIAKITVDSKSDTEQKQDYEIDETVMVKKVEGKLLQAQKSNNLKEAEGGKEFSKIEPPAPSARDDEDAKSTIESQDILRQDDDSPGILAETVENVGNEEIIAEVPSPENEVVTLLPEAEDSTKATEPIYILEADRIEKEQIDAPNNDVAYVQEATPMELAFVATLQDMQPSTKASVASNTPQADSPEQVKAVEIVQEPIKEVMSATDLETLLRQQDQCRIVEYVPSDISDEEHVNVSISTVNDLSQMDIVQMVLGEGLGARLVSDQEQAVDLLALPPDYKPAPLVLKPMVPVSVAPLIVEKVAIVQPKPDKATAKRLRTPESPKKRAAMSSTSTVMQKSAKKLSHAKPKERKISKSEIMRIRHVTGDSDLLPVEDEPPLVMPVKVRKKWTRKQPRDQANLEKIPVSKGKVKNNKLEAVSEEFNVNSSRNSSLTSLDGENDEAIDSTPFNTTQSDSSNTAELPKRKTKKYFFGERKRKGLKKQKKLGEYGVKHNFKENNSTLDGSVSTDDSVLSECLARTSPLGNISPSPLKHCWNDTTLLDITASSTGEQSIVSNEDSSLTSSAVKEKTKKKKKKKIDWSKAMDGRSTGTRRSMTKKSLPVSISQDNLHSEIAMSVLDGSSQDNMFKEQDMKVTLPEGKVETVEDGDLKKSAKVLQSDAYQTPKKSVKSKDKIKSTDTKPAHADLTPSTSSTDQQLKITPKIGKKVATKFPFKIKFKNLLGKNTESTIGAPVMSPSSGNKVKKQKRKKSPKEKAPQRQDAATSPQPHDFRFDAEIDIKSEPLDEEDDEQLKVPKIILKLSPHKSPSIVRSPSCPPRNADYPGETPRSKVTSTKRKVLSPLAFVDSPGAGVSPLTVSKAKKVRLESTSANLTSDQGNKALPLVTDDPELIINLPVDTENTPNETEIKTEVEDMEIKEEKFDEEDSYEQDPYFVGDLMMARLGTFCYWPCMVSLEPDSGRHRRNARFGMHGWVQYHVRFFGDNGRRAWVPKSAMIRYMGPDTIDQYIEVLLTRKKHGTTDVKWINRELTACKINSKMRKSWTTGMFEEASLTNKTIAERQQFFFDMFASKREKALKRKREVAAMDAQSLDNSAASNLFQNGVANIEPKIEPSETSVKPAAKKRKIDVKPQSAKQLKKTTPSTPRSVDSGLGSRSSKSTPTTSNVKLTMDSPSMTDNETKRNYVIEDLELIIKGSLTMKDNSADVGGKKEEKVNKSKKKRQSRKRSSSDAKKSVPKLKSHADAAASEISDTDSVSKLSGHSAITGNRRLLFKDVPRVPVCCVCYKHDGIVVKCKGTCFGFYHRECSQLKEEPKEEEAIARPRFDSPHTTGNVEIVDVKTKTQYFNKDEVTLNENDVSVGVSLMDQLDCKLSNVMEPRTATTNYPLSTTDTSCDESACVVPKEEKTPNVQQCDFVCINCKHKIEPPCFACGSAVYLEKYVQRYKCSINGCAKHFHKECLKCWPQARIDLDNDAFTFKCPMHNCHTCISDNPKAYTSLLPMSKIVRCVKCPGSYHANPYCVPAGTEILSHTQIICPRHVVHKGPKRYTINANWCFICSLGGKLMCCETCPTSVHADCISINLRADDSFVCEDCESGRLPLYDEIVWVKFANFKWWPAVILFPEDIPENVRRYSHRSGEFVTRFYGTHDHHWFALGRVFLFHEDDQGDISSGSSTSHRKDMTFIKAVEEARAALICKKQLKLQRDLTLRKSERPPPYTRIKINRVIGNLKPFDGNLSSTNACNCSDILPNPCGPDSDCLNRLLMTECQPELCPTKDKCQNQRFEKRIYPPLAPYKTATRGWGLKSSEPLTKGQFIIEYVGEIIDQDEYQRRVRKMNEQKVENYYFLTLDGNRTIDAGPKGNLARFMNHCCKPNCETQKWTVRGDTRVGLFALEDIPADTELTFNYNMEPIGEQKKECKCGAENCVRFMGAKNKDNVKKSKTKKISSIKTASSTTLATPSLLVPCFICGENDADVDCSIKNCTKVYHVKCLELYAKPQGKWTCPRHYCNTCAKKTTRSCLKCLESYCPMHSNGRIRFQKDLGYVCNQHNPEISTIEIPTSVYSSTPIKQDHL